MKGGGEGRGVRRMGLLHFIHSVLEIYKISWNQFDSAFKQILFDGL